MYAMNLTPEPKNPRRKGRPRRRLASIAAVAALTLSAAACGEPGGEPTGSSARADVQTSDRPARAVVQQPPEVVAPPAGARAGDSAMSAPEQARKFTYVEAEEAYRSRDYAEAVRRFESYTIERLRA